MVKNDYIALTEPAPVAEHHWPEGTTPLVHTRTMTYNHKDYIRECLDGILMQKTTFPVQVLIHDDASTDGTAEIVREYAEKYPNVVKACCQTVNTYRHPNRRELRAEFFSWRVGKYESICEGDDYWTDPNKLQMQVDFLEENPEYGLVHSEVSCRDEIRGRLIERFNRDGGYNNTSTDKLEEKLLLEEYAIRTPSVMSNTDNYKEIRERYSKDFTDRFMMGDIQLWFRMAQMSKIKYFPEPMACYRMHGTSRTARGDPRKELPFAWNCLEVYMHLAESAQMSENTKVAVLKKKAYWLISLCLKAFSFKYALKLLKYIWKYSLTISDKLRLIWDVYVVFAFKMTLSVIRKFMTGLIKRDIRIL